MTGQMIRVVGFVMFVVCAILEFSPPMSAQAGKGLRLMHERLRAHGSIRLGQSFSPSEVMKAEERLAEQPDDEDLRTQLLGYYGNHQHWGDSSKRKAYQEHVLWLIRNKPRSAALATPHAELTPFRDDQVYDEGKEAWLEQVEKWPKDTAVLHHASVFFTLHDRSLAIGLVETLETLEDQNPQWPMKLGHLFELEMRGKQGLDSRAARKAMAAYERALKSSKRESGVARILQSLAKLAFAVENYDTAKKYATQLIEQFSTSRDAPSSIHYGNTILGRLALKENDLEAAKNHLLVSGRIGGSPVLSSFGPSMALAKELLLAGEWEVVSDYLNLCGEFWKGASSERKLETWKVDIAKRQIPDFGPNGSR